MTPGYRFKSKPLDKLNLTQPFGVDYIGGGFYQKLGLRAHNGMDFSARDNNVFAVDDGELEYWPDNGTGYGNSIRQWIPQADGCMEVIYAHLKNYISDAKTVTAGEPIAISDNTGFSTGPHLHFGIRMWTKDRKSIPLYGNGWFR